MAGRRYSFFKNLFKSSPLRLQKRKGKAPLVEMLEDRTTPTNTTLHWTGAASGSWANAANWQENQVPSGTGDTLIFDASTASTFATINDASFTSLAGISVTDSDTTAGHDFSLSGANVTLTGPFTTSGTDAASQTMVLLNITGAADLQQGSSGTLVLKGSNTYSGATNVNAGTLSVSATAYGPVTSGLQAWYDASTISQADSTSVDTWTDLSGNGHNATRNQGNMTLQTNELNGHSTVEIRNDGYADVSGSLFAKTQFVVFRSPPANATWENYGNVFGKQGDDRNSSYLFEGGSTHFHSNQYPVSVTKNGAALTSGSGFNFGTINQYMVAEIVVNDANTSPTTYRIGGQGGWLADMDVAEIVVYNRTLTSQEEAQLGGYFTSKYGITTTYTPIFQANPIPDSSPVTVASGATLNIASTQTEVMGPLAVNGTGAVTIIDYGSITTGALTGSGSIAVGASGGITINAATAASFSGQINLAKGATLSSGGAGDQTLSGAISATNPRAGGSININATGSGALNLGALHLLTSSVNFAGSGNINVNGVIDGTGGAAIASNVIRGYGFNALDPNVYMNLNNNGGMLNAVGIPFGASPTTFANWSQQSDLTTGPQGRGLFYSSNDGPNSDFNDPNKNGGNLQTNQSNFQDLWLSTLHVTAATQGTWQFRVYNNDDYMGMWIDADQDGIFGTPGGGLGTFSGGTEQISYQDGSYRSYTLAPGDYRIAWTHGEGGGGSSIASSFISPGSGERDVNPSDPTQDGYWNYVVLVTNNVSKSGSGTLTLSAANTYTGTTTVTGGQLVTGAANVIPSASKLTINGTSAALNIGAVSPTITEVHLLNGSITGTTGVLTSPNNFDVRKGTISAILGGSSGLTKTTSSTVTLNAVNTYTGNTTITGGVLVQGVANSIPSGTGKGNVVVNGVLEMNGISETINGLSGSGSVRSTVSGPVTLTVGSNNQTSSFGGVITDLALPSLDYAGTQFNLGSGWRTASVAKTYDADGNNVLGTDGYFVVGDNQRTLQPSYLSSMTLTAASVYGGNGGYHQIDDPSTTPGGSPSTITSGTTNPGGSGAAQLTFTIGSGAPGLIRVGVMIDGLDGPGFNPNAVYLQQIGGTGDSSPVIDTSHSIAQYNDQNPDWLFFDIINPVAGTTYGVFANGGQTNQETLQVFAFDSSPGSGGSGGGVISLVKTGTGTLTLGGDNSYHGTTTVSAGTVQTTSGPVSSGMVVWFDASNASSVHLSDTTVTGWDDLSGNGHHATDPTNTTTYVTNEINGHPTVQFRNSWLNISSNMFEKSVYMVFKSGAGSNFGPDWGNVIAPQNDHASSFMLWPGTAQFWNDGDAFPEAVSRDGVAKSAGDYYNLGDGTVGDFMVLKVNVNNNNTTPRPYYLGRTDGWTNGYYDVAEIISYDRVLSSAEDSQVGLYLAEKYGITTTYVAQTSNIIPDSSAVTVAAGASLNITSAGETIGSLAGPAGATVMVTNQLTFGGSATATFAGTVSGGGGLVRSGSGTQILTGNNTYTGTTSVLSGALEVDGVQTGAGAVSVVNGATLAGTGTLPGALTSDGTVDPGAIGGTGTLTVGDFTLTANLATHGTLNAKLASNIAGGWDMVSSSVNITLGNSAAHFFPTLNLDPVSNLAVGDYTIINNTGSNAISGQFAGLAEGSLFAVNGQTFSITYAGGDGNNDVVIHNFGSANTIYVDTSFSAGNPNIADADPVAPGAQPATFGTSAFDSVVNAIAAASTGSLIIVNPGTYHEAVNLNKTVILLAQQNVGIGASVIFDSLASPSSGVSPVVQLSNGVNLTTGDSNNTTLFAPITGVGNLTKDGSGTMTLAASNGYNGTTTINGTGVLRTGVAFALPGGTVAIGTGAKLQLGGINQSISSLAGNGTIENASSTPATLTVGAGDVNEDFGGSLADGAGGGALSLAKVGTGLFTFGGSVSTYSGATTVTAGILRATADNALSPNSSLNVTSPGKVQLFGFDNTIPAAQGTGVIENGSPTDDAALTFSFSFGSSNVGNIFQDGLPAGSGKLAVVKSGAGTLVVASAQSFTGGTSILGGAIEAGVGGSILGSGVVDVGASGTLRLKGFNVSIGGLSGAGTVENNFASSATLTVVSGATTFSGVLQDGTGGGALNLVLDSTLVALTGGNISETLWQDHTFGSPMNDIESLRSQPLGPDDGRGVLTGDLNYPNNDTVAARARVYNPASNFVNNNGWTALWLASFTPDVAGQWGFRADAIDNEGSFWIDMDDDGVFQSGERFFSTNGNCCGGSGDQFTPTLVAGHRYLLGIAGRDFEGGNFTNMQFTSPAGGATSGNWVTINASNYPTIFASVATGPGSLTLTGNNTYTGTTTVAHGTLVAASNNALGSDAAGTAVQSGGTLGFAGNVTISEPVTANGSGATGQPGALANISDANTLTTTLVAQTVSGVGQLGIGATAGTLTLAAINLVNDDLTFRGAGEVIVNGQISGNGGTAPTSPVTSHLAAWFDAAQGVTVDGSQHVTAWADHSGNGHDATTASGTPTYQPTGGPNGSPAVRVGGDNGDYGWLDVANDITVASTYIVIKSNYNSNSIGSNWTAPFGTTHGDYDGGWMMYPDGPNGTMRFWEHSPSSPLAVSRNGVNVPYTNPTNGGSNFNLGGGVDQYFVLKVDSGSGFHSTLYSIGQQNDGNWKYGDYSLAEILVYNQVLSTGDQASVNAYLQTKYQISLDTITIPTNAVTKLESGTVTLNGANTYLGKTTVSGGLLVAGNALAFGSATAGTIANDGGSVGLTGGINLNSAETITINGLGASGQPGALVNVSGNNTYNGVVTLAPVAPNFNVGVGALAGTLTLGAIHQGIGNLVFDGAGNIVVSGAITGDVGGAGTPVTGSHLTSWFDASNAASIHFSSGTTVSQWDDLSGNGHNATTASGTPTYQPTGGPNGMPAVRVGADNSNYGWLNLANNITVASTYLVMKSNYNSNSIGSNWTAPFGTTHGDYDGGWMMYPDGPNGTMRFWEHGPSSPLAVSRNGVNVPYTNPTNGGSNFNLGGGVDQYFVLKVDSGSGFHSTLYSIGQQNDGNWKYGDYSLAEILTYDQVLSGAQDAQLQTYLKNKYHIGQGDNSVTKNGIGSVTLSVANTYSGVTQINGGTLVASHASALGATVAGTTVGNGGTLGLQGGITLGNETITVNSGGSLVNVSGNNIIAAPTPIVISAVSNGAFHIGSLAGALTINSNLNLHLSNLTVDGAGDVIINGNLSGDGPGTLVQTPLPALHTFDNAPSNLDGWTLNSGLAATDGGQLSAGNSGGGFSHDGAHPTFRLTSPAFKLNPIGENSTLSFHLRGGSDRGHNITGYHLADIPANSSGGRSNPSEFQGIALRNVATNEFVLSDGAPNDNFNGTVSFSDSQLDALDHNATYVLEMIDFLDGGWGWVTFDDIAIPGYTEVNTVGDNTLIKNGVGRLLINGADTLVGATTINGGTLGGAGILSSAVTASSSAKIAPGNSPAALGTGDLLLNSGATFDVELNGPTAGAQYDQINVIGSVDLNHDSGAGATLVVHLNYAAANGTQFLIVNNDSNDAVAGTFAGIAEGGAYIDGSGNRFTVTYQGNTGGADGNDIILTLSNNIAPTVTSVAPFVGPTTGGNTVLIVGSDFYGVTSVKFGATNALSFTVNSASLITAVAPAGASTVNVVVTNATGDSATAGTTDDYTYDVPTITSVVVNGAAVQTLTGATWSNGSATVTVASTAGLSVGMLLSSLGDGFPTNAAVASIVDGTHFTLDATPSATQGTATTIRAVNAPSGTIARNGFGEYIPLQGQTSLVQHIVVTFNQKVTLDAGAFNVSSLASAVTASVATPTPLITPIAITATGMPGAGDNTNGYTQYILTFNAGAGVDSRDNSPSGNGGQGNAFTAIKDGFFSLNTVGSKVHASGDTAANSSSKFFSLYGAVNAADITASSPLGDGNDKLLVDGIALGEMYQTFGSFSDVSGSPAYNVAYDSNLDGIVDGIDLGKMYANFGTIWQF